MNNCLPTQLQRDHNDALSTLRDRNGPFRDISYEIRTKENRSIFPLYLFCMRLCNESRKRFEAVFFFKQEKGQWRSKENRQFGYEGRMSRSFFIRNKSFASQHWFASAMSFSLFFDSTLATLFSPPSPLPIRYRQNFCLTAIRRMMLIRTFRLIARESIRGVISRTPCAANDHCYRRISYMNHCESRRMIFCESLLREPPDE